MTAHVTLMRGDTKRPGIWPIALLIALFLLLGALHVLWSPIFIKPDEAWHMGYVEYLRRTGGLPSVRLNLPNGETRGRAEPEGHQPPLYYAAVALATLPIDLSDSDNLYRRNPHFLAAEGGNLNVWAPAPSRAETAFYGGRAVSLLFGAVAVAATYGAALEFLPWGVALMAAAALAFNPQFLVISTSLSNDVPAVAWCSLALWAALRSMRRGLTMRRAAAFGLAVGLGTLTKLSGLLPIALLPLMVIFPPSPPGPLSHKGRGGKDLSTSNEGGGSSDSLSLWERVGVRVSVPPRGSKTLTQPLPVGEEPDLSAPVLSSGGGRENLASPSPSNGGGGRGVRDRLPPALLALALALLLPLPWFIRNRQLYGDFLATAPVFALMGQRPGLIPPADLAALLLFIGRSYWLDVGPGGVGFGPPWLYLALAALLVVCGVGVVVAWRRRPDWRPPIAALVWYALIVLASVLSLGTRTRTFMGGGRLAFPFAGALAILLALGAWSLVPKRWQRTLVLGWSGAWLALAAAVTWLFVAAPFAPPPIVAAAAPPTATFDGGFVLRDAHVGPVDGAGNASVTLDWEVTGPPGRLYSVFVQALNPAGPGLLAQVDTLPGRGYFPWERWTPGETRRDGYTLSLPTVDEPQRVPVVAGLYDAAKMQRLTAAQDGRAVAAVAVGHIVLRPTSPLTVPEGARLAPPVTFGGARLVGAEVAPNGQTLTVTLWWQADGPLPADYTVFVHLLGANGLAATGDGPAAEGRFPTSAWAAGDVVRDEHSLALDKVAPGAYRVGIGLYDAATGGRVAAAQGGVSLPDDTAIVGAVTK